MLPDGWWCFYPTKSKTFPVSHQIFPKDDHGRNCLHRETKHAFHSLNCMSCEGRHPCGVPQPGEDLFLFFCGDRPQPRPENCPQRDDRGADICFLPFFKLFSLWMFPFFSPCSANFRYLYILQFSKNWE